MSSLKRSDRLLSDALPVGVFALDQVRSLQRNAGKQTSGSTVREDGCRASKSNIGLDVPVKTGKWVNRFIRINYTLAPKMHNR